MEQPQRGPRMRKDFEAFGSAHTVFQSSSSPSLKLLCLWGHMSCFLIYN